MDEEDMMRVPVYFPEGIAPDRGRAVRVCDLICYGTQTLLEFKQGRQIIRVDWDDFFRILHEKEMLAQHILAQY